VSPGGEIGKWFSYFPVRLAGLLRRARGEGVKEKHGTHTAYTWFGVTYTRGGFDPGWVLDPNVFLRTLDGIS
jgi:hypothetical protein